MARVERVCLKCRNPGTVDTDDIKKSDYHRYSGEKYRNVCKVCYNAGSNDSAKRKPTKKTKGKDAVTVDWCPRDEWPRLRFHSNGQFQQMLNDGILTPGMCVTQHDKQYVVWGAKGAKQWLKAAVDKRGRTL